MRGEVTFENRLVDDFVMLKSDGFPTYHLANVVDDHLMEISHVMRAEEWLSSTPKHVRLYDALGWDRPAFAHLPIILAPDRAKLSKRHGAASVLDYRVRGYLPDAMVNFLTLLGWSLDDRTELFSRKELVSQFGIERVGKAGAVFSVDKLDWMNGVYLREMEPDDLADALLDYWRGFPPEELRELPDRTHLLRNRPPGPGADQDARRCGPADRFFLPGRDRVRDRRPRPAWHGPRPHSRGPPVGAGRPVRAGLLRRRAYRGRPAGPGRRPGREGRPALRGASRGDQWATGRAASLRDAGGARKREDARLGRVGARTPGILYSELVTPRRLGRGVAKRGSPLVVV